jgi:hypothetical protein
MGYTSDVAYAVNFKDVETKQKFVALAKIHPEFSAAIKECEYIDEDKKYFKFYAQNVKWYDDYDDVKMHMHMLELVNEAPWSEVAGGKFVRSGEELGDTEEQYYGVNDIAYDINIYIYQSLQVNL